MPPASSVGFAPADWLLAAVTAIFLLAVFGWRPAMQRAFEALASRTRTCMALLFFLPVALRLLLLPHHPVPTPDVYDEFSHLLLADTLLHGRLANPPHAQPQFFETLSVLQTPNYSSIWRPGLALLLAFGRIVSGIPWAGVLVASGVFCASCYWMLRAWIAAAWALLGGLFAVMQFGPLCQWTNSYWGGFPGAVAGCLVFGSLPRLRLEARRRDAVLLGTGFGLSILTDEWETLFLLLSAALFVVPRPRLPASKVALALAPVLFALLFLLVQNKAVTQDWTATPEGLSQYQFGVPASLSVEPNPMPHAILTPQQELSYRAQSGAHGQGTDSLSAFLLRLEFRVRYYRFFFQPPLYLALIAFVVALFRNPALRDVAGALGLFAIGTNLFPYFLTNYLAPVACLFVLAGIAGLEQFSRWRIRGIAAGFEIARILIVLCVAEFGAWYALHLFETADLYPILEYETWDSINHANPQHRIYVKRQLTAIPGPLLVFVQYSPTHAYQNEWVWNEADIDSARIVFARDLGFEENEKLIRYYPRRKVLLLQPDGFSPKLSPYAPSF